MQNYFLFHVLILWIILIAFFDRSRALKLHLNAWCIKLQVISKNPSTRGNVSAGIWLIKGKELGELSQHKMNSESLHKKRPVIRMRFLSNWIRWCDLGQDMVEKKKPDHFAGQNTKPKWWNNKKTWASKKERIWMKFLQYSDWPSLCRWQRNRNYTKKVKHNLLLSVVWVQLHRIPFKN